MDKMEHSRDEEDHVGRHMKHRVQPAKLYHQSYFFPEFTSFVRGEKVGKPSPS